MGKNVTGWKLGDKVGVGCFIDACRNCHACEIKDDNYCPGCVLTYNSKDKEGNPTYGGYSTHLIVDHRQAFHSRARLLWHAFRMLPISLGGLLLRALGYMAAAGSRHHCKPST